MGEGGGGGAEMGLQREPTPPGGGVQGPPSARSTLFRSPRQAPRGGGSQAWSYGHEHAALLPLELHHLSALAAMACTAEALAGLLLTAVSGPDPT